MQQRENSVDEYERIATFYLIIIIIIIECRCIQNGRAYIAQPTHDVSVFVVNFNKVQESFIHEWKYIIPNNNCKWTLCGCSTMVR